ncbi:HdeD family acid-resistance protein [Patescibacteria group bacterium]
MSKKTLNKQKSMLDDIYGINPWSLVVRGILAIVFGLLFILWPGLTITTLIIIFGLFAIVDGMFLVIFSLVSKQNNKRWYELLPIGILGIVIGALILAWPGITVVILIYLIAIWAIISGIGHFTHALSKKDVEAGPRWLYAITGFLTIIIGIVIFVYPIATTSILIWILGFFLLIYGLFAIISGFWVRAVMKKTGGPTAPAA